MYIEQDFGIEAEPQDHLLHLLICIFICITIVLLVYSSLMRSQGVKTPNLGALNLRVKEQPERQSSILPLKAPW